MSYTLHNFKPGEVLFAQQLNEMDGQIAANEQELNIRKLSPSGDDQTQEIVENLTANGICRLGKGDYYVSRIVMPAATKLCGCGEATRLHFADGASGNMVEMGDKCTVSDVSFYGADESITLDGDIPGCTVEADNSLNLWGGDSVAVPSTARYKVVLLQNELPAGTYRIGAVVSREADEKYDSFKSRISFQKSATAATSATVAYVDFDNGKRGVSTVVLDQPVKALNFLSLVGSQADYASEWTGIKITRIKNNKCGVCWAGAGKQFGMIRNCRFYNFDLAGLLMQDTGVYSDRNLQINNCIFDGNNVGIYIRRDSEYNLITNCVFVHNYYGCFNRGGNNYFTNCGFEQNCVGMRIDKDEGGNGAHGCVSNCSFNHSRGTDGSSNQGYGLIIISEASERIANCIFGFSSVYLEKASLNTFVGCSFANNPVDVIRGQGNTFIGCSLNNTTLTVQNSPGVMFNSGYLLPSGKIIITETAMAMVSDCVFAKSTGHLSSIKKDESSVVRMSNCYFQPTAEEVTIGALQV